MVREQALPPACLSSSPSSATSCGLGEITALLWASLSLPLEWGLKQFVYVCEWHNTWHTACRKLPWSLNSYCPYGHEPFCNPPCQKGRGILPSLPWTPLPFPHLGDLLCELPSPCLLASLYLHPNLLLDISTLNTYPSSATSLMPGPMDMFHRIPSAWQHISLLSSLLEMFLWDSQYYTHPIFLLPLQWVLPLRASFACVLFRTQALAFSSVC